MKKNPFFSKLSLAPAMTALLFFLLPATNAFAAAEEAALDASSPEAAQAALWAFICGGLCTLLCAAIRARSCGGVRAALGVLLSLATAAFPVLNAGSSLIEKYRAWHAAEPAYLSEYEYKSAGLVTDADFYVSPEGDDGDDGSFAHPFRTPERARDAVRALDKTGRTGVTVALMAGDYRVSHLDLSYEDGGTPECPVTWCAYGNGEVALNGGLSISPSVFTPVTGKARERLSPDARGKVLSADLSALGLTPADYGKVYAIGTYNTASMYDGDYRGPIWSELFVNDKRCTLARYPDEGYLKGGDVVSTGDGYEKDGALTVNPNWGQVRNPKSDVYSVDKELAARIASWDTLDDVWIFGFPKYDWADASSPIGSFNAETRELSPKFVSLFGTKAGAPYYFFNVFEELDSPGEFYIDRENGILYLYPPEDFGEAGVDLSLSTSTVLTANVSGVTFRDLTFKGTRTSAAVINGDRNTVEHCVFKNVAGHALILNGADNLITDNEVTRTGQGGFLVTGGDTATLTPGNNRVVNNLIHDWSEIYLTYQPAVSLSGAGNYCEHNEIYNSPHEAITYSGNNHTISYNRIHDVCLLSGDAGAIYAGRSWICYGNRIIYNCIYDLGSGNFTPNGIYLDDALSGQTVIGNLLLNIPGAALMLGGGRDLDVRNNIVIMAHETVSYDQRAVDGVSGGWFTHAAEGADMWRELYASPWQTQTWREAFPQMARFSDDFSDPENPDFVPNPAYSTLAGNLAVAQGGSFGNISDAAYRYSEITGNSLFRKSQIKSLFADPDNGDYTIKDASMMRIYYPEFEPLPLDMMGRYSG